MPPLLIAHRAGNDLKTLAEAFAVGVDYAEADVWLYRGRLEVRHDKTAGPLPILWEKWYLKAGWGRRLLLDEVVRAAAGRGRLYLDLKGEEVGLPAKVMVALRDAGVRDAAFSSPLWWYLDQLAGAFPESQRFYTLSNLERVEQFRPRLDRRDVSAIAISSEIVTPELIGELRDAGVEDITTWGVETRAAADAVLASGVNGVTSKNLDLLAELRRGGSG